MWSPIQHSSVKHDCHGKFLLFFPNAQSLQRAWHVVEATTRADLLGGGAKYKDSGESGGCVLVYTPEDKEMMHAVACRLVALLDLQKNIYWKSDQQTATGQKGSKYYFDIESRSIRDSH